MNHSPIEGWLKDLRVSIFGICAEEVELAYGPIARWAFDMGQRGLAPHGRFADQGVMFLFCLEGSRQYAHDRNISKRVADMAIRLALEEAC